MTHRQKSGKRPKTKAVLRLPGLEQSKTAVLNSPPAASPRNPTAMRSTNSSAGTARNHDWPSTGPLCFSIDSFWNRMTCSLNDQRDIRADIQAGVWEHQTAWAQKRDIYAGLLRAVMELQASFVKMHAVSHPFRAYKAEGLDQLFPDGSQYATQLRQYHTLALIFASRDASEAVTAFIQDLDSGLTRNHERAAKSIEKPEALRDSLVQAPAKTPELAQPQNEYFGIGHEALCTTFSLH